MTPVSRRIAWAAGAVAVAASITLGAWTLWRSRAGQPTATAEQPAAAMKDMPGMAGMRSMPTSGSGTVQLSPSQIRQFGITFGTAERRRLTGEVRTTGVVTADETRVVEVAPRFGGFVEQLHADFTGRAVRRGEPLLAIYSPEVFATMQELVVARRMARATTPDVPGGTAGGADLVAAARQRLQLLGIGDAAIDAALESGQVPRTVTLFAPAAGVITE